MGKLVIKHQGKIVGEANLKLGDTTIGRKPGGDIVLDDPVVSGAHAVVKTVGMKSTIYDLGSTNGTFIGNQRVKQHELRHGETIVIGSHALVYRDDMNLEAPAAFGKRPPAKAPAPPAQRETTVLLPFAQLLAVEGRDKGKRVPLVQDTVPLDNPGKNPARVGRSAHGYVLEASIGPGEPRVNGKPVPPGGQLLEDGDLIEVAGTTFRFSK
jgi:hypothetical protein